MLNESVGIESATESVATDANSSITVVVSDSTEFLALFEEQEEVAAASTARSARAEMILVIRFVWNLKNNEKLKLINNLLWLCPSRGCRELFLWQSPLCGCVTIVEHCSDEKVYSGMKKILSVVIISPTTR